MDIDCASKWMDRRWGKRAGITGAFGVQERMIMVEEWWNGMEIIVCSICGSR